jgi:hypothetical protein
MHERLGFLEFGKKHAQVHLDVPGLCPSCLELYISGRAGGARTKLLEEVVDGKKTGKWICPDGGLPYNKQFPDDAATADGPGLPWPRPSAGWVV